jgi:hypothetical protein
VVTSDTATYLNDELSSAGWVADADAGQTGDVNVDGVVVGFVLDANGTPVAGATVTGSMGGTPFYGDSDATDGLFATGGTTNAATAEEGLFVVPAGPIGTYEADDGGTHDFQSQLMGSLPAYAAFYTIRE